MSLWLHDLMKGPRTATSLEGSEHTLYLPNYVIIPLKSTFLQGAHGVGGGGGGGGGVGGGNRVRTPPQPSKITKSWSRSQNSCSFYAAILFFAKYNKNDVYDMPSSSNNQIAE
jgi:hypothetical protein